MLKIEENDLNKINGGREPEEFDWHTKGYETPIKEHNQKGWVFEAINQLGDAIKKIKNK